MPDYIYLIENRLSADQQSALRHLREVAREAGILLFLTGDAVRDMTSGHSVRDLEVAVQGNALKLKKALEKRGGHLWGEDEDSRSLYLCFPGTVRLDVVSTHRAEYPKPGKPIYHWSNIQDDLRRRDFTVNAMAISLNEGSFGLLMDPLNGAADIEARTLRLVSNYGFLDEPALLIRATRLKVRLGWELDPRTQVRYENAKEEKVIDALSSLERSRELEQIGHEEEALKVLAAFESEGWNKALFPAWTSAKADVDKLHALHDLAVDLLMQGVHADMSAAQMQLLTAKLAAKDLAALKKHLLRPGFVAEWNSLDSLASGFSKLLLAKENAIPSAAYRLFTTHDPEAVLWLGFTGKNAAVQEKYRLFLKEWPEARQRIPHVLMQEMRITPELADYSTIVETVFLALIDGKLTTDEEMRAFLEPYSPPAPPPPVTIKRTRARRNAEAKLKESGFGEEDEAEEDLEEEDEVEDIGGEEEEIGLGIKLPKIDLDEDESIPADEEAAQEEEEEEDAPAAKHGKRTAPQPATSKTAAAKAAPKEKSHPAPKPPAPKPEPKAVVPASKAKAQPAPAAQKAAIKSASAKKPAKKPAIATTAKPPAKHAPAKTAAKPKPAAKKAAAQKPATKKTVSKPAKKTARKR